MKLFGFEIRRQRDVEPPISFAPENKDDGAVNVSAGGAYGQYIDLDGTIRTEAELVNKYRQMSFNPEIDQAIDEITNEAIVSEEGKDTVELILDEKMQLKDSFKNQLLEEFDYIKKLLEFHVKPYDIFKTWYRDGRLYYHIIVDEKNAANGIQELRYLDPRKIRKIRENIKKRADKKVEGQNVTLIKGGKEYFIYNEKGLFTNNRAMINSYNNNTTASGMRIAKDSILHCTSGVSDTANKMMLSHLHKAIRPLNQLRALEDAVVIYRISRAPERRIFYIDIGNLPKMKAEQYLKDIMTKYKNRLVYDANTGAIRDDRRFQTMLEDYWFPMREGGRGTKVDTLPAGQNLGEMEDVKYFQSKLFKSLNVPVSRLEPETVYNVGRATEITRDEVKFAKFINRLRLKFSEIFLKALETQLILKQIITPDDWEELKDNMRFRYLSDNYFSELKESEIMMERMNRVIEMDPFAGKYFPHMWLRKEVLRQTDDEIKEMDIEIQAEATNPQYNPPEPELPDPMMGGPPAAGPSPAKKAVSKEEYEELFGEPLIEEDDMDVDKAIDQELKAQLVNMLSKENEKDNK